MSTHPRRRFSTCALLVSWLGIAWLCPGCEPDSQAEYDRIRPILAAGGEGAIGVAQSFIAKHPEAPELPVVRARLAVLLFDAGRMVEAEQAIDAYLTDYPGADDELRLRYLRALIRVNQKRSDSAVGDLQWVIANARGQDEGPWAHYLLAWVRAEAGAFEASRGHLRDASIAREAHPPADDDTLDGRIRELGNRLRRIGQPAPDSGGPNRLLLFCRRLDEAQREALVKLSLAHGLSVTVHAFELPEGEAMFTLERLFGWADPALGLWNVTAIPVLIWIDGQGRIGYIGSRAEAIGRLIEEGDPP